MKFTKLLSVGLALNVFFSGHIFASKDVPVGQELQLIRNHFAKQGSSDDYEMSCIPITYIGNRDTLKDKGHKTIIVKNAPAVCCVTGAGQRTPFRYMKASGHIDS